MAIAETARLLASIELQDKFSGTIKTIEGSVDKVGAKLDGIGAAAGRGVNTAKTRFGELKTALKDSNTQIGIVGTSLAAIENFVPPNLRPFVDGLQDLNRIAPNGIPGLVGTALSGLKTLTANTVTVIGKTLTGTAAGGTGGVPGFLAAGGAAAIAAAAAPAAALVATGLLAEQFNNDPTRTQLGIKGTFEPIASPFDLPKVINNFGTAIELFGKEVDILRNGPPKPPAGIQSPDRQEAIRDFITGQNRTNDRLEEIRAAIKPPPAPIVNLTVRNQILGQTVTTTYSRYSTAVTGTGGRQI